MCKIVETKKQFEGFLQLYENSDVILQPILTHHKLHPKNNELCAVFVRIIDGDSYILPFNHDESLNNSIELVKHFNSAGKIYTLNKKELNHTILMDNVIDVSLLYYINNNRPLDIEGLHTSSHNFIYQKYYNHKNLNRIIPLVKHIEYYSNIVGIMEGIIKKCNINEVFDIYNKVVIDNLSYIEDNGLCINSSILPIEHKSHLDKDGLVYTEYNLYTSTGRPSNRFGGINFAALNKDDGSRKPFISRYGNGGMLVEYDYDAYHVRLIGDIVDYDLPDGSVHKYLGKYYGEDDYDKCKGMTFKLLYGGIPKEIGDNIPFFGKVAKYIENKWKEYKRGFSVKSDIYNKEIRGKNLIGMNASKLFNYLIQLDETETNMNAITRIRKYLEGKKTKLVLYSYDSFLFDYSIEDGKNILKELKDVIENNKFPTKIKVGKDYDSMVEATEKINGL